MSTKTYGEGISGYQNAVRQACMIKACWWQRDVNVTLTIGTQSMPNNGAITVIRTEPVDGVPFALLWRGAA